MVYGKKSQLPKMPKIKGQKMRTIAFHNIGCKVNSYETDAMAQKCAQTGYKIVDFEQKADIYVVNTCSVTNIADRKSRQMLHKAKKQNPEAAKRILIKGDVEVSPEAAKVFASAEILLLGNESQTVGPENDPMEVHLILLGADVILLEGIRLEDVSEGVYLLNAAPLNLSGADGSPCRAVLMAIGG